MSRRLARLIPVSVATFPCQRVVAIVLSCAMHGGLVVGAFAFGREPASPNAPSIVMADLVPAGSPAPVAPTRRIPVEPTPLRPALAKTAMVELERFWPPTPAETRPPIETSPPIQASPPTAAPPEKIEAPPATVGTPAPPPTGPVSTSSARSLASPPEPRGGASPADSRPRDSSPPDARPAAGATAMAIPDGLTRTAIPRGGYQVRPVYPTAARRFGIQGTTTLRIYVGADGRVADVVVEQSAGHPDLDQAASDAVRRWRFEPARRGSEPVGMWVLLPVEFRLQ